MVDRLGAGRTLMLLILSAIGFHRVAPGNPIAVPSCCRARGGISSSSADWATRAIAGLLLIIPGILSDVAAVLLLISCTRHWLLRRFLARFGHGPADPAIIDGEFRRMDDLLLPDKRNEDATERRF